MKRKTPQLISLPAAGLIGLYMSGCEFRGHVVDCDAYASRAQSLVAVLSTWEEERLAVHNGSWVSIGDFAEAAAVSPDILAAGTVESLLVRSDLGVICTRSTRLHHTECFLLHSQEPIGVCEDFGH